MGRLQIYGPGETIALPGVDAARAPDREYTLGGGGLGLGDDGRGGGIIQRESAHAIPAAAPEEESPNVGSPLCHAGAAGGSSLPGLDEQLRLAYAELDALRLLLSTPLGRVLQQSIDGRFQVLLADSMEGYDLVLALPGAVVRGDVRSHWGTTAEAVIGRTMITACWPLFCSGGASGTHAYVGAHPATYERETRGESGRCLRCGEYIVPAFDPSEVAS